MKYLEVYNDKCIGCNTCMSACSKLYFKEDNFDKSRIQVYSEGEDGRMSGAGINSQQARCGYGKQKCMYWLPGMCGGLSYR